MDAIKDFIGGALTVAMVVVMWAIGCMVGVIPIIIGFWLWSKVLA